MGLQRNTNNQAGLTSLLPYMQKLRTFKLTLWQVLFFLSLPIAILTITGFGGRIGWAFEMTSHFRVQYFFILIAFTVLFILGKKKKLATYTAVFGLTNLILISPYWFTSTTAHANKPSIQALLINLDIANSSYEKMASFITQTNPDILILEEFDGKWKSKLENTLEGFPHSVVSPWKNGWSIGLFSRLPLKNAKLGQLGESPIPYAIAEVEWQEKLYNIIGVHLKDPITDIRADVRNRQLSSLTKIVKGLKLPTILLGDLNITPWSPYFQLFIKNTGLRESRLGLGLFPTWPTNFFPLQIPIDHSLASPEVMVQSFRLGPDIGSDHFPIIIKFS